MDKREEGVVSWGMDKREEEGAPRGNGNFKVGNGLGEKHVPYHCPPSFLVAITCPHLACSKRLEESAHLIVFPE